jgi:DNA-binding transcriptional ArsR family regulator
LVALLLQIERDLLTFVWRLIMPAQRRQYWLDEDRFVRECLPSMFAYQGEDGWAALGDPTRRAIVASLAEGPRAVGELAAELPVSRPAVSQALKILKDAGLVSERAVGTKRIYRLNPVAVAALRDQLDTYWSRALASYGEIVEGREEEKS